MTWCSTCCIVANLSELGQAQPDLLAIIVGVDAQITLLDSPLNVPQAALVKGCEHEGGGIWHRDGAGVLQRGGSTIEVNLARDEALAMSRVSGDDQVDCCRCSELLQHEQPAIHTHHNLVQDGRVGTASANCVEVV